MDKKKVLIVSACFYPENSPRSFRTTELAKEFSRQGHDVTVYIPNNGRDYTSFAKEHSICIKSLGVRKWQGIEIRGGRAENLMRRILSRGLKMLFEWPDLELMFIVSGKLKTENGYNLLISIAVPHPIHWGVAKARKDNRKIADCWVADCGDPYMGDTTDSFSKLFYFKYIEKWFCRKADYITIPFGGAKSAYYKEFYAKIRIIPQGFQLDNLHIKEFEKTLDFPVFAYAGGFIPGKRDPGPILEYLSRCNRKFKFIVYTSQKDLLSPYKESLSGRLEIREIIPREDLLLVLSGMDFLINFDNNTGTQLPSKLIDYAITERPVLNVTSVTDYEVLNEFLDGNYSNKMSLEPAKNYDIRAVGAKFLELSNNS